MFQSGRVAGLEGLEPALSFTITVWIEEKLSGCDPEGDVCKECCRGEKSVRKSLEGEAGN